MCGTCEHCKQDCKVEHLNFQICPTCVEAFKVVPDPGLVFKYMDEYEREREYYIVKRSGDYAYFYSKRAKKNIYIFSLITFKGEFIETD